jgi:hypothetical protein
MYKKHEEANVNTHNEFGNDSMKMCLKYPKKMKVIYIIKDIEIEFLSHRL